MFANLLKIKNVFTAFAQYCGEEQFTANSLKATSLAQRFQGSFPHSSLENLSSSTWFV